MTRSASRRDCDGSGAATNLQASFSSLLSNLGPALGGQTAGAVLRPRPELAVQVHDESVSA
jgi:hypothetical protein